MILLPASRLGFLILKITLQSLVFLFHLLELRLEERPEQCLKISWEKILSHRFLNCAAHDRLQCDCNARKKSVRSQKIKTQTAIVGVIILQFLGLLACPELYYG